MKRILFVLISALIVFGCAAPGSNNAGVINGTKIAYPDFIRAYQGHTANFQLKTQQVPNNKDKIAIFDETWQNITRHVILKQYFKSYGIRTTNQEVLDTLAANPPEFLRNHEAFVVDGKFNGDLYLQSLRYDNPLNLSLVRREYLEYYVPIQKLKEKMIEKELANNKDALLIAEIITGKADFDLIAFDANEMVPYISDAELESYYNRNLEDFAMQPIFSVQYLNLVMEPLDEDRSFVKAVADSIFYELNRGKNMERVHRERQEQLPGLTLLDAGFVRVDSMDEELLSILEPMVDNAFSRPQSSGRGFIIYQKLQRTKSMMNYRALQIPPILSPYSRDHYFKQATSAMELAKKIGIDQAADELDLQLIEQENIEIGDLWHPDRLIVDQVHPLLMQYHKGKIFDPMYSPISGSWIIIRLSENQVNRVYPFEKVKERIIPIIMDSRKHELARQKANEWVDKQRDGRLYADGKEITSYTSVGLGALWQGQSLDMPYVHAMQRYLGKKKPHPQQFGEYQIVIVPKKFYADKRAKADRDLLKDIYTQTLEPEWFDKLLESEMRKAKVEIYTSP